MSITRLAEPCWIQPADLNRHQHCKHPLPHYRTHTAAAARPAAPPAHTNPGPPANAEPPRRLTGRCYLIQCDDCGGIATDDEETLTIHYTNIDTARDHLDSWHLPDNGPIRCRWCHARHTDWPTTLILTQR